MQGTGITGANDTVIGLFQPDGSVSVLSEGSASGRQTGARANILLGGNLAGVVMSARGSVFCSTTANYDSSGATLPTGAGNAALFRWSPAAGLTTIALSGDTAPGTGGGQFLSFNANSRAVNGNDQIALLTNLVTTAGNPGGVTTSNDLCLYATDINGGLILIAREGFALPGDPVAGRTVTSILFGTSAGGSATNGQDGRGTFFNDMGQLAFNVGFSDGNSASSSPTLRRSPALRACWAWVRRPRCAVAAAE